MRITIHRGLNQIGGCITEGTMLARNVEEVLHEAELIPRVKNQLDVYPYVFILISATDWERIVTIKDAVKLSG